jgi:hypothetical protein
MKHLRCAECGVPINFTIKATSQLSEKIIYLIAPHSCDELKTLTDLGIVLEPVPMPVSTKFIQKLDELNQSKDPEPGDRRPKDQVKDSIAPKGLLDVMRNKGGD